MVQFGTCGPNCGHNNQTQPQFVMMPVAPAASPQQNPMDVLTQAKANAQMWDDFVKSLQKEKKEEKKEDKGPLRSLTKSEIFLVMLISAPFVNKIMKIAFATAFN